MVPVADICVCETIVHASEAPVNRAAVKSTEPPGMETAAVEPAAVKPAKSAAVETPTTAVRSVGEVRLAERSNAQQRSRDASKSPFDLGPGFIFV
jgi:hypothetical protein